MNHQQALSTQQLPILDPSFEVRKFTDITQIHHELRTRGCQACELGCNPRVLAPAAMRGNYNSRVMILGEALGKDEDINGEPFRGPAGQLLDKIFQSVGLNTNDYYLGNIVKCRPIAPEGSGKQNLTPTDKHIQACSPFLWREIELIKPLLIVTLGKLATKEMIGNIKSISSVRGKTFTRQFIMKEPWYTTVFPMFHPAYLLHSQNDPIKYNQARKDVWKDIQTLKTLISQQ